MSLVFPLFVLIFAAMAIAHGLDHLKRHATQPPRGPRSPDSSAPGSMTTLSVSRPGGLVFLLLNISVFLRDPLPGQTIGAGRKATRGCDRGSHAAGVPRIHSA